MPSNPFVALSAPAALGATLLGVSASLLALDVTGTVVLDRSRTSDAVAQASVAAAPSPFISAATALRHSATPRIAAPSAPAPRVLAPRATALPRARPLGQPVVASRATRLARVTIVAQHVTRSTSEPLPLVKYATFPRPIVIGRTRRATQVVAVARTVSVPRPVAAPRVAAVARAAAPLPRSTSSGEHPIASLREVRRFVIRELRARDGRVCAISATAYTTHDGHVVVDLVLRSRKARWSEKAVVRRSGTDLKLLGVKARALPYWTIASSGAVPGP